MRLCKPGRFNVIVLVIPVAMAMSDESGCSATTGESRPGPMTAEQIEAQVPGNTFKLADQESFAFVGEDGSLRGLNTPSGATKGSWFVSDNGVLCAEWEEPGAGPKVCDTLQFISPEIGYQWGGNSLLLLEGNPKAL